MTTDIILFDVALHVIITGKEFINPIIKKFLDPDPNKQLGYETYFFT